MRDKTFLAIGALLILVSVVSYTALDAPSEERGTVQGTVLIGPQCPVVREGEECPDRPYQATIVVKQSDGFREVARIRSDANGEFSLQIEPGRYVIEPQTTDAITTVRSQEIVVEANEITEVLIVYDSGIR